MCDATCSVALSFHDFEEAILAADERRPPGLGPELPSRVGVTSKDPALAELREAGVQLRETGDGARGGLPGHRGPPYPRRRAALCWGDAIKRAGSQPM